MKVFVTGVCGQLGHDVLNALHEKGHIGVGSDLPPQYSGVQDGSFACSADYVSLDITDEKSVRYALDHVQPDVVIHCAAWTAVDLAEDEDKQDKVWAVNAKGTEYIALSCKELDVPMVYISTDYVFDGQGETPWDPDCTDYAPLTVYGRSKLG